MAFHDPLPQNRPPLQPTAFLGLPLGAVRPRGWLFDQLRVQANGLTGHLDEIWPDVGQTAVGWEGREKHGSEGRITAMVWCRWRTFWTIPCCWPKRKNGWIGR